MTDAELYAWYKKSSHIEDTRFFIACTAAYPEIRARAIELLEENPKRAEMFKRLHALQDEWRIESNRRDRAERCAETVQAA